MSIEKKNKILSIITVTFNAEKEILPTLNSLEIQTCKDFEHIIIDGRSIDKTLDIVKSKNITSTMISERDLGLYDAMNKGASISNSDYILYLNAGDVLFDESVIENILISIEEMTSDIYYGYSVIIRNGKSRKFNNIDLKNAWKCMPFSHQAMIIKREVQLKFPYSLKNTIASDFEFIYLCLKSGIKFSALNFLVARVSAGGLSDIKRFSSIRERWRVIGYNNVIKNMYYFYLLADCLLRLMLKRILPIAIVERIIANKYEN